MKTRYKSISHRKRIYGADTVSQDSIIEEEFNITDLPGLQLWLDSTLGSLYQDSSFSTTVENTNDPVGGWIDKSGNANHAVQSTSDDRPLWGNNVNFNGNIKEKIICNSSAGLTALEIENTIEYLIDKWSAA